MANLILAFAVFFASGISLYVQYKLLSDPKLLEAYARKSPKAWLWRRLFGVEKTMELMRKIFLPLGFVMAILLFLAGLIYLLK